MPAKQQGDAIVIALDVGNSVSTVLDKEGTTFFEQARDCVSWIIQRKIISESKDVLSLLLIGYSDSENPLATAGYKNICLKFDFQLASWDMLKFIETDVERTCLESDWFGALIVSLEMLKAEEEFNNVGCKRVVIFSDFSEPASGDLDKIVSVIKASSIDVTIIGPYHIDFSSGEEENDEPDRKKTKNKKNLGRPEGRRIVYDLWKKVPENVCVCNFESALKQLCSYAPRPKRISYWNCMMDIGEVNINISIVKKTDPKPARKFNIKFIKPNEHEPTSATQDEKSHKTAPAIRDFVMYYKHETGKGDVEVEVKPEDTIEGFRYGTTIVPFSEEDKAAMQYNSGPKSFSVIGFTNRMNVPYYLLSGECSYLVVPRHGDKNAEVALSAIVQGMKKLNCVGLVRRVYSDNRGLSLGALFPMIEEISDNDSDVSYKEYLLFVELAFEDDVKSVAFPSLENVAKDITLEQYQAIDSLIDAMNLMKSDKGLRGEPCESFDFPSLHDFKEQFFHYCVIQRGLHPDKPVQSCFPPHIENFIKVPKIIEENCASVFKEIEKVFKVEKKFHKSSGSIQRESYNREHFSESFMQEDNNPINRVWLRLFAKGFPTENDMNKVYGTFEGLSDREKLDFLEGFRIVITRVHALYLKWNPFKYNRWMIEFKKYLSQKSGPGLQIWEIIVMECVGLIPKTVNQYSTITAEEADSFISSDVMAVSVGRKNPEFDSVEELLAAEAESSSTSKENFEKLDKPSFEFLDELQAEQMNVEFDS